MGRITQGLERRARRIKDLALVERFLIRVFDTSKLISRTNNCRQRAQRIKELDAKSILIMFDSDHTERHVREELEAYAPLIPQGSYIYVQDGCIDEPACFRNGRPDPMAAVRSFLEQHPEFVRDTEVEFRYVMTAHPYGWLKRISVK